MNARCGGRQSRVELADIFRLYGDDYRRLHRLSSTQLKAMRAIEQCRTAELGGHMETCDRCGYERPCYNSCRNRHCPKCQALSKARWLEARKSELLPVPYFHVVFTLPHEINALALSNKKAVYDILFQSVSKTLLAFGEKTLGGKIGVTMILHTWDQQLRDHLHLHCAVAAGALSAGQWVHARKNFLFPVVAMAVKFRGKFMAALKKVEANGKLEWSKEEFPMLARRLYEKPWVVYAKPAFRGPQTVLDYIGRYTHRIAISNERLLDVSEGYITFSWRDRTDGNTKKAMKVTASEFIRRFLLHTLPPSFMKIRHIGFLANKSKKKDLARCKEVLGVPEIKGEEKSARELLKELTGVDLDRCPSCKEGVMTITREIIAGSDTS
jgi:hypothetical protein